MSEFSDLGSTVYRRRRQKDSEEDADFRLGLDDFYSEPYSDELAITSNLMGATPLENQQRLYKAGRRHWIAADVSYYQILAEMKLKLNRHWARTIDPLKRLGGFVFLNGEEPKYGNTLKKDPIFQGISTHALNLLMETYINVPGILLALTPKVIDRAPDFVYIAESLKMVMEKNRGYKVAVEHATTFPIASKTTPLEPLECKESTEITYRNLVEEAAGEFVLLDKCVKKCFTLFKECSFYEALVKDKDTERKKELSVGQKNAFVEIIKILSDIAENACGSVTFNMIHAMSPPIQYEEQNYGFYIDNIGLRISNYREQIGISQVVK